MMLPVLPRPQRFEASGTVGFDAVEFLFPYGHINTQIPDLLESHGLEQAPFNAVAGDWDHGECGMASLKGRLPELYRSGPWLRPGPVVPQAAVFSP